MKIKLSVLIFLVTILPALAIEYHVSINGSDPMEGTINRPFRTIQHAADLAQPGDVITVHEGVYRERINPARGGLSDNQRITYQAATGEKAVIKGSEIVKGWEKVQNDTWKTSIPNSFFGSFNPYSNEIAGDWFSPKGRKHHTGAVYLNNHWLVEATSLDEVLAPVNVKPAWLKSDGGYLFNIAWWRPGKNADDTRKVPADKFAKQQGVQAAECSEGGQCIGYIEAGDWVRYESVDFGTNTQQIEFRAASQTGGGIIEIRLDSPTGDLLGQCQIPNTGDWQTWKSFDATIKPVSGVQAICLVFRSLDSSSSKDNLWFAQVDSTHTTIWAQFPDINPNQSDIEINVRQSVFYPSKPGLNFLTVRGFAMMHAATPWAPPTAEQIGLLGTHWSKGWIIENNDIQYSTCVGITLGKHGDPYDNTSANSAEGYVKTIERAHAFAIPWTREHIGSHLVNNNHIAFCEQAGLVGSLGAAFSIITRNHIHDIHVRQYFSGAEMAGIKIHAAIDTKIFRNHIYRTCRGIWLDWMAQGTRVTSNLMHDNRWEDIFVEVNHGPFLVDNNIFLSSGNIMDWSQGGAYAHNLFAGGFVFRPELGRHTPFHKAHSTEVAGLLNISGGDNRFYNNIFAGGNGLTAYDKATRPMHLAGNVFIHSARPCQAETNPLVLPDGDPALKVVCTNDSITLDIAADSPVLKLNGPLVTTELLGKAMAPDQPYVNPDNTPLTIDTDYFGRKRDTSRMVPGPFAELQPGSQTFPLK